MPQLRPRSPNAGTAWPHDGAAPLRDGPGARCGQSLDCLRPRGWQSSPSTGRKDDLAVAITNATASIRASASGSSGPAPRAPRSPRPSTGARTLARCAGFPRQRVDRGVGVEPAQAQHGLPEAGQHPAPARACPAASLGQCQSIAHDTVDCNAYRTPSEWRDRFVHHSVRWTEAGPHTISHGVPGSRSADLLTGPNPRTGSCCAP